MFHVPLASMVWLAVAGAFPFTARGESELFSHHVNAVGVSEDGRWLATGVELEEAKGSVALARLWDLQTGEQRTVFADDSLDAVTDLAISADGAWVALVGYNSVLAFDGDEPGIGREWKVILWAASRGERVKEWQQVGGRVVFSSDNKSLLIGSRVGVAIVNLEDNQFKLDKRHAVKLESNDRLPRPLFADQNLAFVATNASTNGGQAIAELDLRSKVARPFLLKNSRPDRQMATWVALSADGKYVATVETAVDDAIKFHDDGPAVVLWDRHSRAEIRRFPCPNASMAYFSPDSENICAFSTRGTHRVWSRETGQELRAVAIQHRAEFDDKPSELSIASNRAALLPGYRFLVAAPGGSRDRFADLFRLEDGEEMARFHHPIALREWWTSVGKKYVKGKDLAAGPKEGQGRLSNKVPVGDEDPAAVIGALGPIAKLHAPQSKQSPTHDDRSRLFIFGAGVGKHKFDEYTLKYADKDVAELCKFYRGEQQSNYKDVTVSELLNEAATANRIRQELEALARSCTPNDVAVICLSGHGVKARRGLYFLTYDGDIDAIDTCLNWSVIADSLAKIQAKSIVVLLDCCHAGAFGADRLPSQDEIAKLLEARSDMLIVTASKASQEAIELDGANEKHGLFSFKVLEALRGHADQDKNGVVTAAEFAAYVTNGVTERSGGRQTPVVRHAQQYPLATEIAGAKKASAQSLPASSRVDMPPKGAAPLLRAN